MELTVLKGNTNLATIGFVHLKYKVRVEINFMDVLFVVENLLKLDILLQALIRINDDGDPINNHDNTYFAP